MYKCLLIQKLKTHNSVDSTTYFCPYNTQTMFFCKDVITVSSELGVLVPTYNLNTQDPELEASLDFTARTGPSNKASTLTYS